MIASYDWTSDTWTHHNGNNPARQAFRQAVEEVAQKAREALPEANGRIDRAVKIVLQGDVELSDDKHSAKVASLSNGTTVYHIVNSSCECLDAKNKAPQGFCSHKLAYGIMKRSYALAKERLEQLDATNHDTTRPTPEQATTEALVPVPMQEPVATPATPALPEAPASANAYVLINGHRVQVTLRDYNEETLLERMAKILERFPSEEKHEEPKEGWCSKHNTQMKQRNGKHGKVFWSHQIDGQWCHGK
jgi:hypothetical protein